MDKGKGLADDPPSLRVGQTFVPSWGVSAQRSILRDDTGHPNFAMAPKLALARKLALPGDREILSGMETKEMEEKASQCLLETLLYVRRLAKSERTLQAEASKWKKLARQGEKTRSQYRALKLQLKEMQVELEQAKRLGGQLEEEKVMAEANYNCELDALYAEIQSLNLKNHKAVEEGKRLGRSEYISSEDYQHVLESERRFGVSRYRRSKAYKRAIDTAAAEVYTEGFWQCRDQVQNHISYPPLFDLSFLNPTHDPYSMPGEDSILSDVESEYANLSEVGSNDSN